jgi:hypothetical protein
LTEDQEIETRRILSWPRSNDPFREKPDSRVDGNNMPEERRVNLETRLELIDDDGDSDRLIQAEIFGEPGPAS